MNKRRILIWLVPVAVLALLALVLVFWLRGREKLPEPAYWPTTGWQSNTPEAQGIDSAKLAEGLLTMREQGIDIHSLLIVRNGYVVADANFYPYDGSTVHNLASVTKSIMPALVAMAAEQGKLDLDAPMLSFFPDRTIANRDALKERITVRHLASMSSGLDCLPEPDEPTFHEMMDSPDWVQFALDRKVAWEPGTQFVYCSPAMHLLSPILQQATGITALDFARQNLFAPLGIQDVLWLSDPQGFTVGAADLYLHPHDMAKLGFLWLNGGMWNGQQIIPREWADDSVAMQMEETGSEEGYGYGWWVSRGDDPRYYFATGRGGQRITVAPDLNIILVSTGGGFDFSEIDPLILAALVDMENPLPANPEGVAQLEAAVAAVVQPPAAQPVAPLPDVAGEISGRTIVFEPNPTNLETVILEFDDSDEAIMRFKQFGSEQVLSVPVGLDGVYRISTGLHDLPQGYRGTWADLQTFVLEYDNIANNDHAAIQVTFDGERVLMSVQETAHELSLQVEGQLREP